jgi:hypothetical protein
MQARVSNRSLNPLLGAFAIVQCGCFMVQTSPVRYSESTGCLFGFSVDRQGNPVKKVTVDLQSGADSFVVTTDSCGRFTFNGLKPGTYTVQAKKDGYFTVKLNEPVEIKANQVENLVIVIPKIISISEGVVASRS